MIEGLSHLLTLRKAGLRPSSVWLTIDGQYRKPMYEQDFQRMELVVHDSVATDDFRAFKGLPVTFYTATWSHLAADCLDKLKDYAEEITVLVADFAEDIGYFWTREYGNVDLDEFKWVVQFFNAKNSVCRTDKQVQERLKLEAEALAHIPDLETRYGSNLRG